MRIAGIIFMVFVIVFADLSRGYSWAIPLLIGSIVIAGIMFWVDSKENLV